MWAFVKYNFIAFGATTIDFFLFAFLTKIVGIWYVYATIISAILGGIFAFWMNRNWVFKAMNNTISNQAVKYIAIWISSIVLNTIGIYFLVEGTKIPEIYSKIIISIIVGVFFNFLMNKYYVFKNNSKEVY